LNVLYRVVAAVFDLVDAVLEHRPGSHHEYAPSSTGKCDRLVLVSL
jgi:hypothetical protein